jgi:hypothetical protein
MHSARVPEAEILRRFEAALAMSPEFVAVAVSGEEQARLMAGEAKSVTGV